MLQVVSLMACSPSLEQIQFSAKERAVLSLIAIICDNYRHNTCPLELIFYEHQETTLAKLTIGHRTGSQVVDPGPYESTTPSISVLEWSIDHVHESMQDVCAQVLDSISSEALFFFTSFTLDISSLTVQGLVHVCNVLKRSSLEYLHVNCVPFMPFLEQSIGEALQVIQWPTIKALVLSGTNINDWLMLWGSSDGGLYRLVGA